MAFEYIQQVESFPQCRAGHRKKPCEAVAQKRVDQRACVLETGPRVLETGPRVLETDACILETDACILETYACIFATDACILETDASFVAMECQIQYLMSQPSPRKAQFGSLFFSICVHP